MDELAVKARRIIAGDVPRELESLGLAYAELRRLFPSKSESWFYRALYRALAGIEVLRENHWLVKGFRELGDSKPLYNVWFSDGRYRCDCFYNAFGYARERGVCTHIAAVMLWRRQRMLGEFTGEGEEGRR
ncbi:MAG: hypothetical protein ABWK01_00155 [Infirmifilum sp.]